MLLGTEGAQAGDEAAEELKNLQAEAPASKMLETRSDPDIVDVGVFVCMGEM